MASGKARSTRTISFLFSRSTEHSFTVASSQAARSTSGFSPTYPPIFGTRSNMFSLVVSSPVPTIRDTWTLSYTCLHHLAAVQKEGLRVWDGYSQEIFTSSLKFYLGTADSIAVTDLNGLVSPQGASGCRMMCPQRSRHKKGGSTYYPAALRPHDHEELPKNSMHPDIDISEHHPPDAIRYKSLLLRVLQSSNKNEYKQRRLDTGITKPSIFLGLPFAHRPPASHYFTIDTMHLISINLPELLLGLWRGKSLL